METVVISLGGSLINPGTPNFTFLKKFCELIIKHKNKQFVLVCGGGVVAREYQKIAKKLPAMRKHDLDWIGIAATKINAELVRSMLAPIAHDRVIENPTKPPKTDARVIVASGWKPGCSTDMDAIYLAQTLNAHRIINMSNIDYVYDKDPKKYKNAKKIKKILWADFKKLVGTTWNPGANTPFDPIATQHASRLKMKVAVIGPRLKQLENLLNDKPFLGTLIY